MSVTRRIASRDSGVVTRANASAASSGGRSARLSGDETRTLGAFGDETRRDARDARDDDDDDAPRGRETIRARARGRRHGARDASPSTPSARAPPRASQWRRVRPSRERRVRRRRRRIARGARDDALTSRARCVASGPRRGRVRRAPSRTSRAVGWGRKRRDVSMRARGEAARGGRGEEWIRQSSRSRARDPRARAVARETSVSESEGTFPSWRRATWLRGVGARGGGRRRG